MRGQERQCHMTRDRGPNPREAEGSPRRTMTGRLGISCAQTWGQPALMHSSEGSRRNSFQKVKLIEYLMFLRGDEDGHY